MRIKFYVLSLAVFLTTCGNASAGELSGVWYEVLLPYMNLSELPPSWKPNVNGNYFAFGETYGELTHLIAQKNPESLFTSVHGNPGAVVGENLSNIYSTEEFVGRMGGKAKGYKSSHLFVCNGALPEGHNLSLVKRMGNESGVLTFGFMGNYFEEGRRIGVSPGESEKIKNAISYGISSETYYNKLQFGSPGGGINLFGAEVRQVMVYDPQTGKTKLISLREYADLMGLSYTVDKDGGGILCVKDGCGANSASNAPAPGASATGKAHQFKKPSTFQAKPSFKMPKKPQPGFWARARGIFRLKP